MTNRTIQFLYPRATKLSSNNRIDIARSVNAHIHELIPIGDDRGGIIIDHVIVKVFPPLVEMAIQTT